MNFWILDLGTTNTVGGYTTSNGSNLVKIGQSTIHARTAIYEPSKWWIANLVYGDEAIKQFLAMRRKTKDKIWRLITSPKSSLNTDEDIYTHFCWEKRNLTEILWFYISWAKKKFELSSETTLDNFVISHPVRFSDNTVIHWKALERLKIAANCAWIKNVIFEAEPIAAARKYAAKLEAEETFLIADAWGGTTDFTIVKAWPGGNFEVLASSWVYMGWNDFDRIVSDILSPKLWKWGQFRDWGKLIDIHQTWYHKISEWHNINPFLSREDAEWLKRTDFGIENTSTKIAFSRLVKILKEWMIHEWHEVCENLKVDSSIWRKKQGNLTIHDAEDIIDWLTPDSWDEDLWGLYVKTSLTDIQEKSHSWVEKILQALHECKKNASVKRIDRVVFTGWTCLIPFIRSEINNAMGNPKNADVAPFSAVAEGLLLRALLEN